MPDDTPHLPGPVAAAVNIETALGESGLPASLRILIDDKLFDRAKQLAKYMADDLAFTPKHLRGKNQACFTVLSMALNWKLDPHFVARQTYETPGGAIGFMGTLVQAILEQSGKLVGGIRRHYIGDWTALVGKFTKKTSAKGNEYVVPTWTPQDAAGLGIIIEARLKGESESRYWPAQNEPFYLVQAYPLNSPLWATDPKSQIAYLAVRRFANQAVPGLLGGMPFDEDALLDASERARDITPTTTELQTVGDHPSGESEWVVYDHAGNDYKFAFANKAVDACRRMLQLAVAAGRDTLITAWENNEDFVLDLKAEGLDAEAEDLERLYRDLLPPLPSGPETAGEHPAGAEQRHPPAQGTPRQGEISTEAASAEAPAQEAESPSPEAPQPESSPSGPAEALASISDPGGNWPEWGYRIVEAMREAPDRAALRLVRNTATQFATKAPPTIMADIDRVYDERVSELRKGDAR